jgi:hypothetical protein
MKKIIISMAILTTLLLSISIIGCSAETKYEREFLKIFYEYQNNLEKLSEVVDYYEKNPSNAPEYFNDNWVREAHKTFTATMVINIEKLHAPAKYQKFETAIWVYYISVHDCIDKEGDQHDKCLKESQGLLDLALSYDNPLTLNKITAGEISYNEYDPNKYK